MSGLLEPRRGAFIWSNLVALAVLWLAAAPANAQSTNGAQSIDELRGQLQALLDEPRFSGATWGVKIVSLDTGATVFEDHADRLMSPASNSKLYTGAMALDTFGGDQKIQTPVWATAPADGSGVVHGDLIVSGRADPSWNARRFGTNFWDIFEPFVTVLDHAGVRRVSGDLIADASFFHGPPTGSGWAVDDVQEGESGEISALTLNDNLAQVRIQPSTILGAPCQLTLLQPDTGLVFSNCTTTVANGGDIRGNSHLSTFRPTGSDFVYVLGQMPAGGGEEILDVAVPRPADWFARGLREALARHGIEISGQVRSAVWPQTPDWNPETLVKLGNVSSPPLRDLIRGFMKPSQNLENDLTFERVGESTRDADSRPWETSEQLAVSALGHFLVKAGAPRGNVFFDEGSGLSRNNLTTAAATVALLQYMAGSRNAADFADSLPIAGVDGTLRRRMKNTPAAGNVRAKTGTLRWANSLSGYVTTAAGERLAFSLMLNRYAAPAGRDNRDELDTIAIKLAEFTGRSMAGISLPELNGAALGQLIVTQFVTAPFPHPARANGYKYHDQFYSAKDHYSDSTVAIFVPKNFHATGPVDLVVHFHGWNNTVASTFDHYQLAQQLVASGKNVVLVVPEGPHNAPDSFGGKLEDTNGFKNFVGEVLTTLQADGVISATNSALGDIILSGHSGGYNVMSEILDHGGLSQNIREVWLFDALYGGTENFLAWQQAQKGRLVDIYTDHGGTTGETFRLMKLLQDDKIDFLAGTDVGVTPDELSTNRLIFLHSDLIHNDVVSKRHSFQQFLETSGLKSE